MHHPIKVTQGAMGLLSQKKGKIEGIRRIENCKKINVDHTRYLGAVSPNAGCFHSKINITKYYLTINYFYVYTILYI